MGERKNKKKNKQPGATGTQIQESEIKSQVEKKMPEPKGTWKLKKEGRGLGREGVEKMGICKGGEGIRPSQKRSKVWDGPEISP